MSERILDVRDAERAKPLGRCARGAAHRRDVSREAAESLLGHGGDQGGAVGEVALPRG